MRDKETIEIALEASETGHLVLSTLHTIDAGQNGGAHRRRFPVPTSKPYDASRERFPFIVSQRLIPRKDERPHRGVEILNQRCARGILEKGETEGKSLLDAMRDGSNEGMQHSTGNWTSTSARNCGFETGLGFATNAGNLRWRCRLPGRSSQRKPVTATASLLSEIERCIANGKHLVEKS